MTKKELLEQVMGFAPFKPTELKIITDGLGAFTFDEETGTVTVDLPNIVVRISKRPIYCDRGRYDFWVEAKDRSLYTIDFSDAFPRYFFRLQGAIDEIREYLSFNVDKVCNDLEEKVALCGRILKGDKETHTEDDRRLFQYIVRSFLKHEPK
jgi:hypothetical protein